MVKTYHRPPDSVLPWETYVDEQVYVHAHVHKVQENINDNSREESRAVHSAYSKQHALCTSSDYAMKASDS